MADTLSITMSVQYAIANCAGKHYSSYHHHRQQNLVLALERLTARPVSNSVTAAASMHS